MQAKMTLVFTVLLLTLLLPVRFLSFSGSYIKKILTKILLEENFLLHATVHESVRTGATFILFLLFLF